MGEWLKVYGPTIYGTHAGFIKPQDWGAVTEKANKVYLHIFKINGDKFFIKVPYKVKSARLFSNNNTLKSQALADGYIMVDLKGIQADAIDTVVELEVIK